jgi:uncharacterized protein (TIGR02145 family)
MNTFLLSRSLAVLVTLGAFGSQVLIGQVNMVIQRNDAEPLVVPVSMVDSIVHDLRPANVTAPVLAMDSASNCCSYVFAMTSVHFAFGTVLSDGGAPVVSSGICYSVQPEPHVSDSVHLSQSALELMGLPFATTLYARSFAVNHAGVGYGPVMALTTASDPTPLVTTDSVTQVQARAARLHGTVVAWNVPVAQSGQFQRGFKVSTEPWPNNTGTVQTIVVAGADAGHFQLDLQDLMPETRYHLRAFAQNGTAEQLGDSMSFVTRCAAYFNDALGFDPCCFQQYFCPQGTNCVPCSNYGSVTDADGNVYKTVTINSHVWMAENLRTTRYADGTLIPQVATNGAWSTTAQGASCTPYNSTDPYVIRSQGRLYNWYAATSWRNPCPSGWHVPTDGEWNDLLDSQPFDSDGNSEAARYLKTAAPGYWTPTGNSYYDGVNYTGFSAIPTGSREVNGSFSGQNDWGWWWTSSVDQYGLAIGRGLGYGQLNVVADNTDKTKGFALRCMQDPTPTFDLYQTGAGVTDVDGNHYPSVIVNNGQEWMAANLRTTHYRDGAPIPEVTQNQGSGGWWYNMDPARCYWQNNPSNAGLGVIYNGAAAREPRVCPAGWHVPTDAEWHALALFLDPGAVSDITVPVESPSAGGKLKRFGTLIWNSPNAGADNAAGLDILPNPTRDFGTGSFDPSFGSAAWLWARNQNGTNLSAPQYARRLLYNNAHLERYTEDPSNGFMIRCVRD